MKRLLLSPLVWLSLVLAHGADYEPWAFEQVAEVPIPGLTRLALPPETFGAARPDLADLRLLDPTGTETPFAIERAPVGRSDSRRLDSPPAAMEDRRTRLSIPLTQPGRLRRIRLESAARSFLKAVSLNATHTDGVVESVVRRQVLYRQDGAELLTLSLNALSNTVQSLQIILDDSRTPPIPITAIVLQEEDAITTTPTVFPARIVDRVEGTGETRLTVDLGAAHLPLRGLRFEVEEPLFIRRLRLLSREWQSGEPRDRMLGQGSIHRIALEGIGKAEALEVDLHASPATREVILTFDNGDSPPLTITAVSLLTEPTQLAFLAKQPGRYRLLSGNPEAQPARYDVASLAGPLRAAPAQSIHAGRIESRAEYHRPQPLADLPLLGGEFTPQGWRFSRPVHIEAAGVQRLELPLHVLANTRPDRADVRLISAGRQVLFLEEQAEFSRAWDISFTTVTPTASRQMSRWELTLPQPRLPVRRFRVRLATTLFDREMRLVEPSSESGAQPGTRELGRARWTRTPDRPGEWFDIVATGIPRSSLVWLETDNGDNAALEIQQTKALLPSVQLLFQAGEPGSGAVSLYYGNPEASAPRYDLSLVAPRVLAAAKLEAKVAGDDPTASRSTGTRVPSSTLFYAALILVVVGLAFVISKLVPKPSASSSG